MVLAHLRRPQTRFVFALLAVAGASLVLGGCGSDSEGAQQSPAGISSVSPGAEVTASTVAAPAPKNDCARLAQIDASTFIEWLDTGYDPTTGRIDGDGTHGRFSINATAPECQNASPHIDRLVVETIGSSLRGDASVCRDLLKTLDPDSRLLTDLRRDGHRGGDMIAHLAPNVLEQLHLSVAKVTAPRSAEVQAAIDALRQGTQKVGVDQTDRENTVDRVDQRCF